MKRYLELNSIKETNCMVRVAKINSLTEQEKMLLWAIVNNMPGKIMSYEINFDLMTAIKLPMLQRRIAAVKTQMDRVQHQYHGLFDGLVEKMSGY